MPDDDGYRVQLFIAGSEPEARGIDEHLRSQGIDSQIVLFKDTAYPGIVDRERPWGAVVVPRTDLERAKQMVAEWQDGTPEDLEQAWRVPVHADDARASPTLSQAGLVVIFCIVLVLAFMVATSRKDGEVPIRWSPIGQ